MGIMLPVVRIASIRRLPVCVRALQGRIASQQRQFGAERVALGQVVPDEDGMRLDRWLKLHCSLEEDPSVKPEERAYSKESVLCNLSQLVLLIGVLSVYRHLTRRCCKSSLEQVLFVLCLEKRANYAA